MRPAVNQSCERDQVSTCVISVTENVSGVDLFLKYIEKIFEIKNFNGRLKISLTQIRSKLEQLLIQTQFIANFILNLEYFSTFHIKHHNSIFNSHFHAKISHILTYQFKFN